ncbi:chromate transporter [Anaerococcus sp. AGMB00486]|uniref:Chromate transporter n=2 Tax=Anaerococcus TaxID=165779 RepID=A0ABX2NCC6_9FIRM|nr:MULTISPECIES: chromate transporter [Anaerococcus]MDY3006610.1 chromate transporter [Anaerococcus porci]MSS78080.1 chromate transporter [Anaerococcus porci]NVF12117.1 chromate transporter [Anaerococcus faecalis]
MSKTHKLFKLFINTLKLSAFTFGGGYVILSLMENTFVNKLGWINKEEMLDMTAIAQSSPGAVAINASISVGYKLFGILGAVISTLGTVIPPLVIISLISFFYEAFISNKYIALVLKGMQAGVAALIMSVVIDMIKEVIVGKSFLIYVIALSSFALNVFLNVNIIYIILTLIITGLLYSFIERRNHAS